MKKKGQVGSVLVTVIILAVIFILVIRFYSAIIIIIRSLGEDYFWCLMKKLISAYTKIPIAGVEVWGAFCPPVVRTLTFAGKGDTEIPIDVELTRTQIKNIKKWDPGVDPTDRENFYLKYRMNKAVADAMKRCWGRNGQGELPLGKEWNKWFFTTGQLRAYCDLCAVYKFDNDVKRQFPNNIVLNDFLMKNPVNPGSKLSYWEYIKDRDAISDLKTYQYETKEDLAIVYIRQNINNFNEFWRDIVDILPGYDESDHPTGIDMILIIPFDQFENLGCNT